jgi:TRAP-type C4-dicarboxylate transport system substrate-binding protein
MSPPTIVFASTGPVKPSRHCNRTSGGLESKGIVGLGWTGTFKELEDDDESGRRPGRHERFAYTGTTGAVSIATYQALGAVPVSIDLSETFPALSQHTVDGTDMSLDPLTSGKFYTVIKHVAMSNHFKAVLTLMASKRKIDAFPPALQKIIKEEGRAVVPFWRSLQARQIRDDIQILQKNGIVFTEIQYPAFRKAMDPVYAMLQAKLGGDLLDRVSRGANTT